MNIQSLIILLSITLLSSCNGNGADKATSKSTNPPKEKVVEVIRSLKLKEP